MIVTNGNYFSQEANSAYYSVSQVKGFMECEARAVDELAGKWQREATTSLLVGSYVDAHFSRELDLFRAQHTELYTRAGELRSEYRQAEEIIARIERDGLAMRILEGDKQRIVTGHIAQYPFKAKLDIWLNADQCRSIAQDYPQMDDLIFADGAIVDMKIMRDFEPMYREGEGRLNFIEYWRYDMQLAVYQHLMRQLTGLDNIPCYILAATKEKIANIGLFKIPQELMDASIEILVERMEAIDAVKSGHACPDRCEKCDYCKASKELTGATWPEEWT